MVALRIVNEDNFEENGIRERSHMTSDSEGGRGFGKSDAY